MRAYQVFGAMTREQVARLLGALHVEAPALERQVLAAAAAAMKARPGFLLKRPPEARADAVRRAMARVGANAAAEELLATYFLDCRKPLLVEWLDHLGLEHEDGILQGADPTQPEPEKLREAVASFRAGEQSEDRELLLRAFAAQSAIDWPALDALVEKPA